MLNVMVIGSGGREHAIIKSIKKSQNVKQIFALPGNGGMQNDATCVNINATDLKAVVEFATTNNIDFAVVAPDDPLVLGLVDELENVGIKCFGPSKRAAIIEGSKVFSKNLMKNYNIPTAQYMVFTEMDKAVKYLDTCKYPIVIKADGLALGKGVIIAENNKQAVEAVTSMMQDKVFGDSGSEIVVEEFLTGPEVSVLCFTDGKTVKPMVSSMDHKRAFDGDKGLNTGGMGTIAPNPFYTEDIAKECMDSIFMPTINAMNSENRTFKGCLYFGLMLTKDGAKVIEYNCRFGDPETQVVLPLLKTDLLEIMQHVEAQTLQELNIEWLDKSCACVVIASNGYPVKYNKGNKITLPSLNSNQQIYVAGASIVDGNLVNTGGRVLGVTSIGDTLENALNDAYSVVKNVEFNDSFYRKDIGHKALQVLKERV